MAARMKQPPITTGKKTVELTPRRDGSKTLKRSVVIRHAKFRKRTEIMSSVAVIQDSVGGQETSAIKITEAMEKLGLYVRWGVVKAAGLIDDNGSVYKHEHEVHEVLDSVSTVKILDCLDQDEMVEIVMQIGGMDLSADAETSGDENDGTQEGN